MMLRLFCTILTVGLLTGCMGREARPLYPYRVICGESQGKLAARMAEWMRLGWRPQGGAASPDGLRWCQAIIKE
jgi:hypothetical protein